MAIRDLLDRFLVSQFYLRKVGRLPNLRTPTRFSEKVQLAKLTWRSPLMPILADKVRVKELVGRRLGPGWVTPSLYSGPDLPPRNERTWPLPYVIKTNNGSGTNIFVREESERDWERIERSLASWRSRRYGGFKGEWAYADIPPQVLVEPLIDGRVPAVEYKFFCFAGRVEFIEVHLRHDGLRENVNMSRSWEPQPFTLKLPLASQPPPRPACLDEMLRGAEVLAEGFPFVRIDLYEVEGRPRFGEVTFYPASGDLKPVPPEADRMYGDLWPPGLPTGAATEVPRQLL